MATSTKNTGRDSDKFMLRFPDGMREHIAQAASNNGRTMNAEVVARLQSSFDTASAALPPLVEQAIKEEISARGGTEGDALVRLVLAAQSKGGTIFFAQLTSKTTFHEFLEMLEKGKTVIPKGTPIRFEIGQEG